MSRREALGRQKYLKNAAWFFGGGVIFLFFFFVIGIPLLINVSAFVSNILTPKKTTNQNKSRFLQQPQLESPFEATNSAIISLSGFSPENTHISLFKNNRKIGEIDDKNGTFSFDDISLNSGQNEFYVVAKDQNSDNDTKSSIIVVIFDNKKPSLVLENIKDGDKFELNNQITIKGKLDEDGSVFLNDRFIMVNSDKTFSYDFELQDGDNVLKFKIIDKAGNFIEKEIKVNFHK